MSASWRTGVAAVATAVLTLGGVLPGLPAAVATPAPSPAPVGQETPPLPDLSTLAESDSPIADPAEPQAVGNVAHRGASRTAPENTLSAVRQAIAQGANFVGIDVRRTKDHRLVVLHDASLRRTTDVERVFPDRRPWAVEDFTLAEISLLDAGSWLSPEFTGERVPTLAQALRELAPSSTGAFLEIKHPETYGGLAGIGDAVVAAIERHTDWLDRPSVADSLVVQAFQQHADFLREFTTAHPDVPVGLLGDVREQLADWPWEPGMIDQINVHHDDVDLKLVETAHGLDMLVSTFVVNDEATMGAVLDVGVKAISTDYPDLLTAVLRARGSAVSDSGEDLPAVPATVTWSLEVPRSTQLLAARFPVDARLTKVDDGSPARWSWVQVEHRTPVGWRRLGSPRVTDRNGELRTTVEASEGLRLRMRSLPSEQVHRAVSTVSRVATRVTGTKGTLAGVRRLPDEQAARLRVRWVAEDGRPVTGSAVLWARPRGDAWKQVRTVQVVNGQQSVRVRPRVDTRYELRFGQGSWWSGGVDGHYVDNVPAGRVVALPVRAPQPSVRVRTQRRAVGAGVNAVVSRVPRSTWQDMTGRSWRRGCPVGRPGLRLVRVNYWGYDGYRRRGELVVARSAARGAVQAFSALHNQGFPLRSMHAASHFRRGLDASLAAGNTTGFHCVGASRPGPHATGRTITVNPWENPEVTRSVVSPNRWWLSRSRRSEQVHDDRRHPVVQALAAQGFRWSLRGRDYGRFVLR